MKVEKRIKVTAVQHPNGSIWMETRDPLPAHLKVLASTEIDAVLEVEAGYEEDRAYPAGKFIDAP